MVRSRNLLPVGSHSGVTGHTATSGFGVLTSDTMSVKVSETSVLAGLLHAFDILTQLGVQQVGVLVIVLAILVVLLSVQEPSGELVLGRVSDHLNDLVHLVSVKLTSSL